MISLRNLCKTHGSIVAVQDVSLDIRRGEFFSLLGASGAGKTTLLRMIAGFEAVTSGQILIDGQPMQDTPAHLRPVNMVFQNYAIFPHLNVRDNIGYGLRRLGIPRKVQTEMVDEMLAMIALPGYGDRRAHQLSGGQMQRVSLARALILKPKVLLLDEPLAALDKQLREQMQMELRALQQKLGITTLLVTHDQEEALTLSDRVAVMAGGRVLQVDTPSRLYDAPRNRQVASFVGTMNFFEGTVCGEGAAAMIDIHGLGLHPRGENNRQPGERVLVSLRPEALALHLNPPQTPEPAIPARLVGRQYLGGRQMLHVQIDGRSAPVIVASAAGWEEGLLEGGQAPPMWLTWRRSAMTVLDQ
jgi:ABC-type Fe3+/spermidine/putrescine transport system ATPase subunit